MIPQTMQWRAAAVQLLTIVTGVLVALAAQSLWNRRQDSEREREYLTQLRADLAQTSARVAESITTQEITVHKLGRLRQALHSTDDAPPDSVRVWVRHRMATADFTTSTLDALLQTGDVNLIADDSLRLAIIAYAAQLDEIRRSLERVGNAYLERSANARAAEERYSTFSPVSWTDTIYPPGTIDLRGLRNDPEARAAFNDVYLSVNNALARFRSSKEIADELVVIIDRRSRR